MAHMRSQPTLSDQKGPFHDLSSGKGLDLNYPIWRSGSSLGTALITESILIHR